MLKNIKLIFYSLPVLIAFILPFGNALTSPLIALWFLTSLFFINGISKKTNLKNEWFLIITGFFILTVISNFIFYNANDPLNAIEIKLSFLLFPFLFFLFEINYLVARRIIASFVSGCLFACIVCIGRAFKHLFQGDSSYFYYSNFSYFMHSAYFAMYLNLAVVFVFLFYFKWFKDKPSYKLFSFVLIGLFSLCIILCSSKIGIISLFLLIPLTIALEYKSTIKLKHYIVAFASLLIITFSIYTFVPQVFDRLRSVTVVTKANIDKTATESSSVRLLIWKECTELVKSNILLGVGVSHANETLYKIYEQHGITGALEKKLNAHNQFFQTFIGIGLFGFLNLLLMTIGVIIYAIRSKNNLLLFFGLLTTSNFLVESMLQTSAGNVFFGFFLCFLLVFNKDKLTHAST